MKTNILRILTAVAAAASTVAAVDLATVAQILPPHWAGYIFAASAVTLAVKEVAVAVGDTLDDGKRNGSFK